MTRPRAGGADQPSKPRSIVVATEGWWDKDPAIDHAVRLANGENITIHLVARASVPLPIGTTEMRHAQYDRLVERAVTNKIAELTVMVEGLQRLNIDARAHVRLGDSALIIREIANAVHADLILIACPAPTRRRAHRLQRGLVDLLVGTSVPVLVVPPSPPRGDGGTPGR
ncbi:MAG: universal stress protein [Ilumatobacteraceae bacterium]